MKPESCSMHKFLNSVFENITLCLGGIFLLNKASDELICTIATSLEEIYDDSINTLQVLNSSPQNKQENAKESKPHPAIEKLLLRLEKERNKLVNL